MPRPAFGAYFALFASVLMSTPAWGDASVPAATAERATQIAHQLGGEYVEIVRISKIEGVPGLQQATQVKYMDAAGRPQTLTMLPDGIHFIPGPLAQYRETKQASANFSDELVDGARQASASVRQAGASVARTEEVREHKRNTSPAQPQGAYTPNGQLRPESFTTLAQELFGDDLASSPTVYLSLLGQADAVVDGTNDAAPIVYMLFDPACPYCVNKYRELRSAIDAGSVTVHWIPVAAVSPTPHNGLLGVLDPQADNATRLQRLHTLTDNPRADVAQVHAWDAQRRTQAQSELTRTTSLLAMVRSRQSARQPGGTPQTFFVDPSGQIRHHFGYNSEHTSMLLNEIGAE